MPDETDREQIATGLGTFALDLYHNLTAQEGNLFLSPYSISTCLAMAYAAARGETQTQMAQALRFPVDQDRLHATLGSLITDLNAAAEKGRYQLVVANALWGQTGYGFFQEFLDLLRSSYGGELREVDFEKDPEGARQTINRWVEDQTRDKIKELIGPGTLGPLTRLVLTNAIYFKGSWWLPFKRNRTHPAHFKLPARHSGGATVDVSLMMQTADFRYVEEPAFQVLELPYEGRELSMVIFLPRSVEGLPDCEKSLTAATLAAWPRRLQTQKVEVYLPKLKMTSTFALGEVLRSMGMVDAFRLEAADFSGMTEQKGVGISQVIHKAFVEINEEGTEAAAATGERLAIIGEFEPPPTPVFRADHPFLFLIRDIRSESILFLGRVADPRAFEEAA